MDRQGLCSVILLMATPLTFAGSASADLAPAVSGDRVEQARIPSAPGVVLYGELRLPAGPHGRYPPVLLLGGGGASPHGIYPLLEARLHAKGIATFSFDKRGVGQSTGAFQDAIELAEQDARAVLAYLRSRSDVIDGDRIAILGLSQGAVIAPVLAIENPSIAALVLRWLRRRVNKGACSWTRCGKSWKPPAWRQRPPITSSRRRAIISMP